MTSCHSHSDADAAGACRACGHDYCAECLVYAFGEGKQPYCVACAVHASTTGSWLDRRVAQGS